MENDERKHDLQESLLAHHDVKVNVQEQIIVDEALSGPTIQTGEKQPKRFRDAWAAALFVLHQLLILYLGLAWGRSSLNYSYDSFNTTDTVSFSGTFYLCLTSSVAAMFVAGLTLSVVIRWADQLVQISLCLSLIWNFLLFIYFASQGYWYGALFSVFFLLWNGWYAHSVWRRIPFAAANLRAAVASVQTNGGIMVVAISLMLAIVVWSMLWLLAYLGVYVRYASCESGECTSHVNGGVILLFLTSFFWTGQVLKNVLHVVVAGVVGTWFFDPQDASAFFSPAVHDSLVRATSYSFGSICLGSLATALLQVSNYVIREARRHNRCSPMLMCVLECLVDFLERLVAYFNQYAYVYIGLYGYDYLTAGRRVMTLFTERGWSVIINDHLVLRVLGLMSCVIGILTGCMGLVIASAKPSWVDEFGSGATVVAFFIPFMIGTSLAYILMSVLSSAVDTILVGFAEAPLQFQRNHPGLYTQMVAGWREVYPEEFGPLEMPLTDALCPSSYFQARGGIIRKYKYQSLQATPRYGPPAGDDEQVDRESTLELTEIKRQKRKFKSVVQQVLEAADPQHVPSILARNLELLLSMSDTVGKSIIESLLKEVEHEQGPEALQQTEQVIDLILTFTEEFVEQATKIEDQNKELLSKIIRLLSESEDSPKSREEALDDLFRQEKGNFTPGFLRHLDGQCDRIASAREITTESARLLELLRVIQARVIEELGQDLGEAAQVLGQLIAYENKAERLAVLEAGLTVRGLDFAKEMVALTEEALEGFSRLPQGVDERLVESVQEIDDRLRTYVGFQ